MCKLLNYISLKFKTLNSFDETGFAHYVVGTFAKRAHCLLKVCNYKRPFCPCGPIEPSLELEGKTGN